MASEYKSITRNFAIPASEYIDTNWVESHETNVIKKHVLARGGNLVLAPWSAITTTVDTIIGVGGWLATIATIGKNRTAWRCAERHLASSKVILTGPYQHLLKVINPSAVISSSDHSLISANGDGFITEYVSGFLKNVARDCRSSDNLLKRHVATRLTYVLLIISSLITRVVDGIIGVIAALFSFLTFGKVESINNLAYRALQAPGIVYDLFYSTVKMINPWAGTDIA